MGKGERTNQRKGYGAPEVVEVKKYVHVQSPDATGSHGRGKKKATTNMHAKISIVVNARNVGKRNMMAENFYLVLFLLLLGSIAWPLHFGVEICVGLQAQCCRCLV